MSPEEYLERERVAETKSEYFFGDIVAMPGGTLLHSVITANIARAIGNGLQGKACVVFSSDARVSVQWGSLITYPDVTILCGAPQYTDEKRDTLLNPILLVEVLSPSTRAYDRGEKSRLFRMMPSLAEYLLVDQTPVDVEQYRRLPSGNWELTTVRDFAAVLTLTSLGCEIPVGEIYQNLEMLAV
ncbi:MAG: Uma2 family endonuclease [Bryobacteraceae bacterium]